MARNSVSRWGPIVKESEKGAKIWVGVDVHKSSYAVCVLSETGVRHIFTTGSDNEAFIRQFKERGIKITNLVYESGFSGFGLCRACQSAGIDAMVVAAAKVPRTPGKTAKTDRIDCIKLATYLAKGLLSPIAVPTLEQEAERSKVRRRSQLTKEVASVKNRIKSFLHAHSIAMPAGLSNWSQKGVRRLWEIELLPDFRVTLDSMLRELQFLEEEKKHIDKEIKKSVPKDDILRSVPGVGPVTASVFRTEIFAPERFETKCQLSSFLGLSPVIRHSGESTPTGQLVPCGQTKLRSVLVEAAWRLRSKEAWAQEYYNRIYSHTGKSQSAIIALAHKLAIILWRLWLEDRKYQSDYNVRTAA